MWELSALQQHPRAVCGRPEPTPPAVHRYGQDLVGSPNSCLSIDVSNLRSCTSASFMTHLFFVFQKPVFLSGLSDSWPHFFSLFADTSHTLPPFPSPDLGTQPLPERINMTDIKKLQTLYRDHCEVCPVWAQCFIIITYDPSKHYSNFRAERLKHDYLQAFVALDAARRRLIMLMSVLAGRQKCESEKSGGYDLNSCVLVSSLHPKGWWVPCSISIIHLNGWLNS